MIFLLVMDELDLDAQFVHQFEHRNFRYLGRLISLVTGSDLIGNYPWKTETSVSTEIEWKCTEIKSRICSTRYKLYAVPVRVCITRESYPQYPWGTSNFQH